MAEFSRIKKYKDLRNSLQEQESFQDTTIQSEELSRLARRLNEIDQSNFKAPSEEISEPKKASHAKETIRVPRQPSLIDQADLSPLEALTHVESSPLDNEYISQYLKEAKRYNVEHGNAVSEETSLDILTSLKKEEKPTRPFPKKQRRYEPLEDSSTTDIPFQKVEAESESTQTLTKADIMKEVQDIMAGKSVSAVEDSQYSMEIPKLNRQEEQSTRQQLLNETTSMRAQLENYGDDVASLNTKMRRTNRILNIVLVILIVALVIILAFVFMSIFGGKH
ncbi:hypothetical protein [Bulleidia sp. zg-1006]|uniref:hypothetical protein n=1 Tax=Bulleidia sp. zg-1006 TaxID=2806552 RepID=UPI00193A7386|nr:hypothetical protein [Bulleidia sp. zg-1006]QRG86018.1 hypothetical protein JOS54_03870 [Bulleidia sp. zg-1006]